MWNLPGANGEVDALALSGTTLYTAGSFTTIAGQARNRIAALDADSSYATAWNPNASAAVRELAVSGTTVYAGGDFNAIGGTAQSRFAGIVTPVVGVPEPRPVTDVAITRLSPNPASGRLEIEFTLQHAAHVRVGVFDVQGRLIARLLDETCPGGPRRVIWAGVERDEVKRAGIYFARLEVADRWSTKRFVMLP
jgi:hypothetical protein